MANDIAQQLASSDRAVLIAPAGCGKTHTIAEAVGLCPGQRQLILTHTHAGVHALRKRLDKNGIPSSLYSIDTIAGWSLRLAASYPATSGLTVPEPMNTEWKDVYVAATRLLSGGPYQDIIRSSYAGVYVDEYQDCTATQHKLIIALAGLLKCRLLGDPLQGIFGFDTSDPLVDWEMDIFPSFHRLQELDIPWRWRTANPELGEWLLEVRKRMLAGESFSCHGTGALCEWAESSDYQAQLRKCNSLANTGESVVVIGKMPNSCHSFAKSLAGRYQSMEEIYSADLLKWSDKLEQKTGIDRALAIVDFAAICYTGVKNELKTVVGYVERGNSAKLLEYGRYRGIAQGLANVIQSNDMNCLLPLLTAFQEEHTKGKLTRRDLWHEMKQAITLRIAEAYPSLRQSAWHARHKMSQIGRKMDRRTVSRTLLVKGLEFDHAVVLGANDLGLKDLYVAMTRGAKSLTIFSDNPIVGL